MGNLSALLPNATPLVSRFESFHFRQSLRTFPVIVGNNYPRISGKMGFTIEDKALTINNELINNRFFER
jgi:hypothetical protein